MIRKLKWRFIIIAMLSITSVTITIFSIIIISSYLSLNNEINEIMNFVIDNNGKEENFKFSSDSTIIYEETPFSTRYFTIQTNSKEEVEEINLKNIAAISEEDATKMYNYIKTKNKEEGFYHNYKYKIIKEDKNNLIIFLDCTIQLNNFNSLLTKSLLTITIGLAVVFIILILLSKKAINPILNNIDNQRQFITNASHELKTPLSVILANIEVLKLENNSNKWLHNIKKQADRLDTLINNLLSLSNYDERKITTNFTQFSLTNLISTEIEEFSLMLENKKIDYNPSPNILIYGDKNLIRELIIILIDNAIKYTKKDGTIKISINNTGKNIKLTFSNDCDNNINVNKIFDRFYREDKSHNSKTKGYGIGLSIAKSIIEIHKGHINAEIKNNKIYFNIIFNEKI